MKKIVIIGSGVAGLSAGIYARKYGFDCEIYEKNHNAGGECVSWKRNGYTIDNCVHWMTGTSPDKEIYKTWCEVGVLGEGKEVIQNDSFLHLEHDNQQIDLWHDVDRLHSDMLKISPEDEDAINEFIDTIKAYMHMEMAARKPFEQFSLPEKIRFIKQLAPVAPYHKKLKREKLKLYSLKFKNKLLQKIFTAYMPQNFNVSSWYYVLGTFCSGNGALPKGGSQGITDSMLNTYLNLGGKIFYKKEAVGCKKENKRIKSIIFKDETEVSADYFVMTCDVSVVFDKIVGLSHIDKYFKSRFDQRRKHPIYSSINVYMGVDRDKSAFLSDTSWWEGPGFEVFGKVVNSFLLKSYASEPSFAPEGKTILQALIVQYEDDFECWRNLYENDREIYKRAKQRIAKCVVRNLQEHYPQIGDVEIEEVVTPMSYYRWCGSSKGSYMSFVLSPFAKKKTHKGRILGLKNTYLAGQWIQPPGGLPNAVVTGKFAIQRIVKDNK